MLPIIRTGLVRILAARRDLLKDVPYEPFLVVGPRQLNLFLYAYKIRVELDMQFLNCECTARNWCSPEKLISKPGVVEVLKLYELKKVLREAGLETLISFHVDHCPQAFGVSMTAAKRTNNVGETIPGWKTVYSVDTRPCPQLIEESENATEPTVLIHQVISFGDNNKFTSVMNCDIR